MMKKLFLRSPFLPVLFLCCYTFAYAQDTTKAKSLKPVIKQAAAKPVTVKYAPRPVQAVPAGTTVAPANASTQAPVYGNTPASTDKSLSGQYQYVLTKTYRYQQPMIAALWHNINDTLKLTRQKLKEAEAKLKAQSQSISSLQNDVKTKDDTINDATNKSDEISLLGIPFSKGTYNLLMWGLVLGLGVVLFVVILRTTGNSREAKYRTKLYEELSEEFQAYKVKANEKEKKLARELQTERNKVDELMGRG